MTLLFERFASLANSFEEISQLARLARVEVIHIDNFPDLAQGKSEAFPAQYQFQANAISRAVYPLPSNATGHEEFFVLVKSDGSGGHIKFFGELGYGKFP